MRLLPYVLALGQVQATLVWAPIGPGTLTYELLMPIHEYNCARCEQTFEAYVHTHAQRTAPRPCPACAQPAPYAGLSAPAVGREQHFGLIMNDGGHLRGTLK